MTPEQQAALVKFARWVIQESFDTNDIDGGDIFNKARELGLLTETKYDPDVHGPNDYDAEPGDQWFVPAPHLGESP